MMGVSWSILRRYVIATAAIIGATVLRLLLDPLLGDEFPFATLFFAVLLAAWSGGRGPALLATGLGTLAAVLFLLPPRHAAPPSGFEAQAGLVLFVVVSLGMALLGGSMWSARDRAETSAREAVVQREQLRTTLTSIGDAVIATDALGRVTTLNPVATALTGWSLGEARGRPLDEVFRIINERTRRPAPNPVERVLREGVVVGLANHTAVVARDGTERPIEDSAAPIRDADGSLTGVVLVFRDVTERRRADEARLHLAAIVESSEDAIVSKTLEGVITSWNAAAQRLYGYSAEEVVGRPYSLLVPPGADDPLPRIVNRLLHGEATEHYDAVRRRKDGTLVDVSANVSPIRNEGGTIVGVSVIARDVTERKRVEKSLRLLAHASAALSTLVDYKSTLQKVAHLAVPEFADWCVVDVAAADGSLQRLAIAHADPSKVRLAEEMLRRYPPDPDSPYGVYETVRTGRPTMLADIPEELISRLARDEDHLRMIRELGLRSFMCVPLRARGRVLGVLSFVSAESGRRYTPGDLVFAEELARRSAIAVENAEYYEEVREAARRKDELLAVLAHELRNPLAPIRNAVEILRGGAAPAETSWALGMMDRQVHHLMRLVDDLLDVSRIMRGKVELRKEMVALAQVVGRAIETSQPTMDEHGHQLSVSLPDRPVLLDADPVRLAQVIGNLLTNAAKYTGRGGTISLTAGREGSEVVVRVRDTGIGIAPEVLPRIFDMFMQVHPNSATGEGGLGIGLTLVKSLTEMHGGRVEASSGGIGQGSEFVVRLPGALEPPAAGPRVVKESPGARAVPRRNILVVDDHADAGNSLALLLRLSGHEVRVVHTGPAALEAVADRRPDVIFLDIGMPGMDGYEVARRLRQLPAGDQVLIVALTGWGQEDDRRRTREAGFDLHLVKPAEVEALYDVLRHPRLTGP